MSFHPDTVVRIKWVGTCKVVLGWGCTRQLLLFSALCKCSNWLFFFGSSTSMAPYFGNSVPIYLWESISLPPPGRRIYNSDLADQSQELLRDGCVILSGLIRLNNGWNMGKEKFTFSWICICVGYEPGAAGCYLCHCLGTACLRMRPKPRKAKMRDREIPNDTVWVPGSSRAWNHQYLQTSALLPYWDSNYM